MGPQKEELSLSVTTIQPKRKKKNSSLFLARTQPMKSHRLLVYCSPPDFLLLSIKEFSSPGCPRTCTCLPWLQTLNFNSLLIPNKPIFAGEIAGSLFVLGQHYSSQKPVAPEAGLQKAVLCSVMSDSLRPHGAPVHQAPLHGIKLEWVAI